MNKISGLGTLLLVGGMFIGGLTTARFIEIKYRSTNADHTSVSPVTPSSYPPAPHVWPIPFDINSNGSVTSGDVTLLNQCIFHVSPCGPGILPVFLRDKFKQPFARDSIWNWPIGSGATRVSAGITSQVNGIFQDPNIIIQTPNEPLVNVELNNDGWNTNPATGGGDRCADEGATQFAAPIPASYIIPGQSQNNTPNNSASILMPDGRTIKQTQPLTHCTTGGPWTTKSTFGPDVDIYGQGEGGSHGGSHLSSIGGTIRLGELVPGGKIPHALAISVHGSLLSSTTGGFRWPATTADQFYATEYTSSNSAMKMGTLLALPTNFNVAGLSTEPGRILAQAFKDYGGYIVDTVGNVYSFNIEQNPILGDVEDQFAQAPPVGFGYAFSCWGRCTNDLWEADIDSIMLALEVINNNTSTSKGGGGSVPSGAIAREIGN